MSEEPRRDPAEDDTAKDADSDLARPVPPPSLLRRSEAAGPRHFTRRVIAPAFLLLVSVPVVVLLLVNLRAVSESTDSDPASAGTPPSASASPSAGRSASETPSESPTPTPTPTPTATPTPTPTPTGPSVASVTPVSGSAAGGQVLVLRGSDLDPVTQVLFGALSGANLQHVSSTEIRVTTPANDPGRVALQVKAGADDVSSGVDAFTYR